MAGAGTLALAVRTPGSVPGSSWTAWRRHAPLGGPCVLPPGLPLAAETLPPPRRGALGVHSFCQMRLGPGHSMPRQALGPLPLPDGSGALPFLDGVVVWAPTITRRSRDSCDVPSIYYEGLGPCPSLLGWTGIPTICQEVSGLIPPGSVFPTAPRRVRSPIPSPRCWCGFTCLSQEVPPLRGQFGVSTLLQWGQGPSLLVWASARSSPSSRRAQSTSLKAGAGQGTFLLP